ncbi:MAG: ATP-binding protein [Streptococcaceae bacterium]|jgi:predicted AAA+ superfamily ATPase|nr:ATP-binding protein [Streptococcaceae bacterium]
MIKRKSESDILQGLEKGKVVILYGARQVGKTTLVKEVAKKLPNSLYASTDDPFILENLYYRPLVELKAFLGETQTLIIDEAQRIENIGLLLKLLHDELPDLKIIATGSSSFDLANKINEPLTGRKNELFLPALSIQEVSENNFQLAANIPIMLLRGGYPEVWTLSEDEARARLREIASSYVYKDVFAPNTIYDQTLLYNLMRYLAYQIGNEVSYHELSQMLEVSAETIKRYIDLLEKAFIIFRQNQYRKNQRVAVGRKRKIYFNDLGIRNALIDNFAPLDFRDDRGAMWENFCVVERKKLLSAQKRIAQHYYWRNNRQQEIDLIEEENGQTRAFEMKFRDNRTVKIPREFSEMYPDNQSFDVLTTDNFLTKGLQ